MWNLRASKNEECLRLQDALEDAAADAGNGVSADELLEALSEEDRRHMELCGNCREAAEDLAATKAMFRGMASFADEERPWFVTRVMAAIASRERELAKRISAWSEFPRFASRLAWVAGVLLLVGTTWFYEAVVRAPHYAPGGSQESIFEGPPQSPPDDLLASRAGDNP